MSFRKLVERGAAGLTGLLVLSIVADLLQVISWLGPLRQPLLDGLEQSVPLWVLVVAALAAVGGAIRLRRQRPIEQPHPTITNEGAFLTEAVDLLQHARSEVYACLPAKTWIFTLLPAILGCRLRGLRTTMLIDRADPSQRYGLLAMLGIRTVVVTLSAPPPFRGFIADASDPNGAKALALSIKPVYGIYATSYYSPHDCYAVASLRDTVESLSRSETAIELADNGHQPVVEKASLDHLLERMRRVPAYSDAKISLEEVDLANTLPRFPKIVESKYRQAAKLINLYEQQQWRLFEPVGVRLANGNLSLLIPPVFEEINGRLVLAEGHSRIFTLIKRRIREKVCAVVVRDVSMPPPASAGSWRAAEVSTDRVGHQGISRYARHIETNTHWEVWPEIDWTTSRLLDNSLVAADKHL